MCLACSCKGLWPGAKRGPRRGGPGHLASGGHLVVSAWVMKTIFGYRGPFLGGVRQICPLGTLTRDCWERAWCVRDTLVTHLEVQQQDGQTTGNGTSMAFAYAGPVRGFTA